MRVVVSVLACLALLSGCLDDTSAPTEPDGADARPAVGSDASQPQVVLQQEFFDAYAAGTVTAGFTLDQPASALQITVDFGTSAFTDFRFSSPEPCAGLSSGAGVYPNSSSWMGQCGALPAGDHALAWTTQGTSRGTITVVAVP